MELLTALDFLISAMARPVRILVVITAALVATGLTDGQETTAAPENHPAGSTHERAISPRVAALLAAAAPKFEAPKPDATIPMSAPALTAADRSANEIIRLPNYIVREPKLPKLEEVDGAVLTRRLMERYLGPEDGFDRGFLNLITSKQIPLLGLFGSMSNEQRARMFYAQDERRRKMNDLLDLAALGRKPGATPGADKLKREIDKTFMREPDFGK